MQAVGLGNGFVCRISFFIDRLKTPRNVNTVANPHMATSERCEDPLPDLLWRAGFCEKVTRGYFIYVFHIQVSLVQT